MRNEKPQDHGPSHYMNNAIQPIDYVIENGLNFCEGNVIKYITRWRTKGGIDDLRKARHYIDFLIADELNRVDAEANNNEIYQSIEDEPPF
jgi:hypothetical protein